ncbi:hypothetical protein CEXT_419541, partial [Caerostris extrusa]
MIIHYVWLVESSDKDKLFPINSLPEVLPACNSSAAESWRVMRGE